MKVLKNQRGDTILEVLLAVTVLSLIMAATFALANRNIQSTRQAAERSEAYKVAQSEIEKLKLYLAIPGAEEPGEDEYFCMDPDAGGIEQLSGTVPGNPFDDPGFTSTIYQDAEAKGCKTGPNNLFYKLTYRGTGDESNTYTSYIRWPSASGNGVDQSSIVHRLYPDVASSFTTGAGSPTIPTTPTPPTPAPPPVTPPTPPTFNVAVNGNNYVSCSPAEAVVNDGADGCFRSGNSMFARRAVSVNYNLAQSQPNGSAQVRIFYRQYPGASTLPQVGYNNFALTYRLGADATRNANLPISRDYNQRQVTVPVQIVSGNDVLNITWVNNFGNDPDLQIDRVELFR